MKINDIIIKNTQLDEAEFNPNRRGFLKKAGAVAASAAMPKGLAGSAMKAVAPAAENLLSYSSPELSKILELLRSEIPSEEIKDIAMKCARGEDTSDFNWGDEGYNLGPIGSNRQMSEDAAKALLRMIDKSEKNKNYDWVDDIVQEVEPKYHEAWQDDLLKHERGELKPDDEWYELLDTAEMDIYPEDDYEPSVANTAQSASAPMRASSLASAVSQAGKKTAQNTVINQPAKDMGKIEPTTAPMALAAPTMKTGMQIPKQKSNAYAYQKDKEDDKELERLREMIRQV
jgi:hypothetical protein